MLACARPALGLALALAAAAAPAAAAPGASGPGDAAAARHCSGPRASALRFHRRPGRLTGRLSWRGPRRARYRVERNRAVVGQTRRRWMKVAVRPGRRYRFVVRVVPARPQPVARRRAGCPARLTRRIPFHRPGMPRRLAAERLSNEEVGISWLAGRRGDARTIGYRIYRNGETLRQTRERSATVRLAPGREYALAVAAVDSRGRLSPRTQALAVRTDHVPPGAPGALAAATVTDSAVTLGWSPAPEGSAPVAGYRVYRDGALVSQFEGAGATVDRLAPATAYRFSVAAIDRSGYLGPETPALEVATLAPPPTQGGVHAFLLASTDQSFRDFQAHYRLIGTVYPTYYECAPDGSIGGQDDPLITGWARLRGVAVLPRVNCQSATRLHRILTDPATRAAAIARIDEIAAGSGYDGVNLDFESGPATDRDALTSFVADVADRLHARGRRVAVEVSAKTAETTTGRSGFYDYTRLGAVADTVFVMDWGLHWASSGPGSIDDLPWARQVADYVATMPQRRKYVLGFGLYGIDWPAGGGAASPGTPLEYADVIDLATRTGATPVLDATADSPHFSYVDASGVAHDVWYQDAASADARIRLARERGLDVGFWRLGREDQRIWDNPLLAP